MTTTKVDIIDNQVVTLISATDTYQEGYWGIGLFSYEKSGTYKLCVLSSCCSVPCNGRSDFFTCGKCGHNYARHTKKPNAYTVTLDIADPLFHWQDGDHWIAFWTGWSTDNVQLSLKDITRA